MYIINSGIFVKISNAINMLINDKDIKHSKSKEFDSKRKRQSADLKDKKQILINSEEENKEPKNLFNFDSSKFTLKKINKMILFNLSKTNPYMGVHVAILFDHVQLSRSRILAALDRDERQARHVQYPKQERIHIEPAHKRRRFDQF